MKIDDIFELWGEDSKIDKTDITSEAINIPQLHHKYYKLFTNEKFILLKYESELKQIKIDKFEFYTQGPTPETEALGWKLPPIGKILKSDANKYVDSDKDIVNLTLKIAIQNEKVLLLADIIKNIANRNFILSNAINWEKFRSGV